MAEKDAGIRNDYIEEYASLAKNSQNEFHTIYEADHTTFIYDENFGSQTIWYTISFLNKITAQKKQ